MCMIRRFLVFLLLIPTVFLLSGRAQEKKRIRAFVTHIDIYAHHSDQIRHYRLTDDKEMDMILNHFRAMNRYPASEEPPVPDPHHNYTVWVWLSTGRCHLYEQLGARYFRKDTRQWKVLDPQYGQHLIQFEGQFQVTTIYRKGDTKFLTKPLIRHPSLLYDVRNFE